jgi:hypothetical protein
VIRSASWGAALNSLLGEMSRSSLNDDTLSRGPHRLASPALFGELARVGEMLLWPCVNALQQGASMGVCRLPCTVGDVTWGMSHWHLSHACHAALTILALDPLTAEPVLSVLVAGSPVDMAVPLPLVYD